MISSFVRSSCAVHPMVAEEVDRQTYCSVRILQQEVQRIRAVSGFITSDTLLSEEEGRAMPTRNPRVNVVLEPPIHKAVQRLARRDGISVSAKIRDLVLEALEAEEDVALARLATERADTFAIGGALSHEQVWGKRRVRRR